MTYTVANFGHVEWQGLDLFEATSNSAQLSVVSSPLQTGFSRSLQFTGNASRGQVGYAQYGDSTNITAGNAIIWHGYFRWSDISPATEYPFLAFDSNTSLFSSSYLSLVLETDGDIRVRDAADATVATITAPLTVDTFHRFEIRFTADSSAGQVQIWIDGTEVLSNQTGEVFGGVAQMDYVHIGGPLASSGNMFFAGAVTYSDSTTTADRLDSDFEIIGPYQNTDTTTTDTGAGDVAGDALDAGDWTDAGETPVNTSNVASYTGTPRDGGVYLDSGARAGPSGDGRITGTIDAMQAVFIASRGTGGGTTHTLVAGNKTDEYDAAATFAPAITTSFAPYFLISEAATAVPTSSQYGLLGFEVSGAQELNIGDMAMFLLHVPAAGTTVDLAAGSFTFSGKDTTITRQLPVALAAGSYAFSGKDTTITKTVGVDLNAGSFSLSGQDLTVTRQIPVALDAASYTFSGQDAAITRQLSVALDAGGYTFTGLDSVVSVDRPVNLDAGSFTLTGNAAGITRDILVGFDAGSFTFTGLDLTVTAGTSVPLDAASYTFTGFETAITRDLVSNLDAGSFTFTGLDATATKSTIISLDVGSFALSGQDAGVTRQLSVALDAGSFSLTGEDLTATISQNVPLDAGSYTFSGKDTVITRPLAVGLDVGGFTFSGKDASITRAKVVGLDAGSYTMAGYGFDVTLRDAGGWATPADDTGIWADADNATGAWSDSADDSSTWSDTDDATDTWSDTTDDTSSWNEVA